jgi:hypothetical protein
MRSQASDTSLFSSLASVKSAREENKQKAATPVKRDD